MRIPCSVGTPSGSQSLPQHAQVLYASSIALIPPSGCFGADIMAQICVVGLWRWAAVDERQR